MSEYLPWKVLEKKYLFENKYMTLRQEVVELPSGDINHDYFIREWDGFVSMFAMTDEGKILICREYKHGVKKDIYTLPSGMIDEGENPFDTVKRELQEETGYCARDPELVGRYVIDPSSCDGHMYLYFCSNVKFIGGKIEDDPGEEIENLFVTPEELREMLADGRIDCIAQIAAIRTVMDIKGL
jgi:8-oxo-dGTP pyrophosphatase MutT (NUDIX family)